MTSNEIPVDYVDVLIIGAGPAGLMMALWMSQCGVRTRIVDKRGTKIYSGQAAGLQCRTLEIFDSFSFGHRVWHETNHMIEICFWNPPPDVPYDPSNPQIQRSGRIPDTIPNISRFQQANVNQGYTERVFMDAIKENSIRTECNGRGEEGEIKVEYAVLPTEFNFDGNLAADPQAYPIAVKLRHLTEAEATPEQSATSVNGQSVQDKISGSNISQNDRKELSKATNEVKAKAGREELVKAKYMLGADGAHSWVRRELGFKLKGDSTDYVWGALDIIPITDFPDIRMRCTIHSAEHGTVMIIPREHNLVRLYTQLTATNVAKMVGVGERADRTDITPELILGAAQKIMRPYKISYRYLDWWTAYQVGQRIGDNFSLSERVFLAGDAIHTHSPKAGQGLNISIQDSYNLGWKVAGCLKGHLNPTVLKSYQSERRKVAQDLIDFDYRFSRMFSGRPTRNIMDAEGISMAEFQKVFEKGNLFASGIAVDYAASAIVVKEGDPAEQGDGTAVMGKSGQKLMSKQARATKVQVGTRMPSFKVLNQSDARPWHLQQLLKSNGAWRVMIFAGNIKNTSQKSKLQSLGAKLGGKGSFLKRFTPSTQRYDSIIEVLTVHSAPRQETSIFDFAEVFRPWDDNKGWDYGKIYVDDWSYHEGHGEAYKNYGIEATTGCAMIVRPDQYVSWIGDFDDYETMDKFFSGFMIEQDTATAKRSEALPTRSSTQSCQAKL